ncbi:Major facilitator superfamily [Cynara cardunculus var. scolymus]|uniref:Major facilitator superfamily n=1 Tax=Cynara cardunculus var. scolymus TaxID=59895 RepID=A0A103XQ20_CYNCS|nr:Major facilitator superfamily [Cynara cardunculus var. scolymus]
MAAAAAVTPKSAAFGARSSNLSDAYLNSICLRKPSSGFRYNIERKWGNLSLQGGGGRNRGAIVERENRGRRGVGLVKCTAEGIERGILTGGRAQKDGFVMPERLKVVALMACVMCLCNADRVVMSVAIVPLAAKHGWSSSFLGIVQITRTEWGSDILWFPCNERATAVGLSMGGFHLGNVVGLVLTPIVMSSVGISGPFILFSSLGLLWLTMWTLRVTNDPQESRSISNSELRLIQAGKSKAPPLKKGELPPLRLLLSKMPTWAIIFANVTNNWGYFVLLSWMPVYFKTVFNVNLKQAAWFSAVPWGTMAFSGYVAGAASDYLIKEGHSLTFVRKVMQSIGFIGPGLALLCLNYAKTPVIASVYITVALSLSAFSQAGFLLNMQDIAPQYAGFLHGISNSAGTLAAIISTIGTGYFVQWLGSFQAFLTVTAGLYFVTAIFWNIYATGERVF